MIGRLTPATEKDNWCVSSSTSNDTSWKLCWVNLRGYIEYWTLPPCVMLRNTFEEKQLIQLVVTLSGFVDGHLIEEIGIDFDGWLRYASAWSIESILFLLRYAEVSCHCARPLASVWRKRNPISPVRSCSGHASHFQEQCPNWSKGVLSTKPERVTTAKPYAGSSSIKHHIIFWDFDDCFSIRLFFHEIIFRGGWKLQFDSVDLCCCAFSRCISIPRPQ